MRREGQGPHGLGRPVDPRFDRAFIGLTTSPKRKLATSAGAMLAVGSLAGAAALLGHTVPGPAGSSALDGGYPESGLLGTPGGQYPGGPFDWSGDGLNPDNPLLIRPVAFPTPAALANPAGVLPLTPTVLGPTAPGTVLPGATPGLAPTAPAPAPAASAGSAPGGAVGGALDNTVSGVGDGVGGALSGVGDAVGGPLGGTVGALGGVVSGTTRALGGTLDNTIGVVGAVGTGTTRALGSTVTGTGDALGGTVKSLGKALQESVSSLLSCRQLL